MLQAAKEFIIHSTHWTSDQDQELETAEVAEDMCRARRKCHISFDFFL